MSVSIPTKKEPQHRISAAVLADSITEYGHRITTMSLVMPRMILAEFNTHRMFSRNSASSRAIPTHKVIEMVKNDPFVPIKFIKEHKGMQGYEYLSDDEAFWAKKTWLMGAEYAIHQAELLSTKHKVSKQFANRMLEPYMWHKVLVTATEWENFFALRYHGTAEIHMQTLAQQMLLAMNNSTPRLVSPGEWHMPYSDDINESKLAEVIYRRHPDSKYRTHETNYRIRISVSRSARISYALPASTEKHDYSRDVDKHDDLVCAGHWSPLEHQAQAPTSRELCPRWNNAATATTEEVKLYLQQNSTEGWWGNFRGWKQYRKILPGHYENRSDNRLIKH